MTEQEIEKMVHQFINGDYSDTTFATTLFDMFDKRDEDVIEYIKPGREFWHFDGSNWRKLKVTYVRSGVMFFVFEDKPDVEEAWFICSFNVLNLNAAQIYPYEIAKILSKTYPNNNFAEICKQCKWEDYGGKIKVEVIWPEDEN